MGNWIDHLVFASPSLETGIEHVTSLLGTAPVFGGRHEGAGTHNAVLSLGPPTYLEVLAPDPEQNVPSTLIDTGTLTDPRLYGFAIGCDDIDEAVRTLRDADVAHVTEPFAMTRLRADGTMLAWRLAFIGQGMGCARPFLISWGDTPSPAEAEPVGGRFLTLRAGDPDPETASRPLNALGVDVKVEESATPWLRATIQTAAGIVEFG